MLIIIIFFSLLLALLSGSCASKITPATEQKVQAPIALPVSSKADWEQEWERIVGEAKKEGKVSLYTMWGSETRELLGKAFKEKFGITLEYTAFGRGAELLARVQAEKRAGLNMADAFGVGGTTLVATMKPLELLGSLEPFLLLPEVKGPEYWSGGQLPFQDKDKRAIGMIAYIQRYIVYNSTLLKPGEITTYRDALKPQFKGKVTLNDPTVTGVGNAFFAHVAYHIWNQDEAIEFLKQLIKQQNVVIQRDNRLHLDSVAKGKFAIGLAPHSDVMEELLAAGAPIDAVISKEGTFVSPGVGALAVPTQFRNLNAAKVFVNWLLSKEGQTIFARSRGFPSLRKDVSIEGLRPIFLPQAGEKLYLDSEEFILFRGKMMEVARKAIEEALR